MSLVANIVLDKARNANSLGISPAILTYASKYGECPTFLQVIDELCKDGNIRQMLYASDCKRPAIEPVLYIIETICRTGCDFDIFNDDKAKQTLGVIAKIILELYGYIPTGEPNKDIIVGYSESISSATIYKRTN